MTHHDVHEAHDHTHGNGCGHKTILHGDHHDYLHDGHMHDVRGERVEEHRLSVDAANPDACTPSHACSGHLKDHAHGPACGHDAVRHGDHTDYVVDGHLHRIHDGHCDDHGPVTVMG